MNDFDTQEQKVIDKVMADLDKFGPDRVITHSDGSKVPFQNALDEFKVSVEFIFIRDDGWTLGCSRMHETTAYNESPDWIAVLIKPESEPRSFDNYGGLTNADRRRILPSSKNIERQKIIKKKKVDLGVWNVRRKTGTGQAEAQEAQEN